jgi:hypothetical protein
MSMTAPDDAGDAGDGDDVNGGMAEWHDRFVA